MPLPPEIPRLHLAIRFLLELATLAGYGIWGWQLDDGGISGLALATLTVTGAGAVWGIFRTPEESPRGHAVVAVPGWLRLLLEVGLIGLGAYGVWTSWSRAAAETLLTVWALHYAVTWERIRWLLRRSSSPVTD